MKRNMKYAETGHPIKPPMLKNHEPKIRSNKKPKADDKSPIIKIKKGAHHATDHP